MEKVLLGMSGGKDSTWACRVLQKMGYEVEGLFLILQKDASSQKAELSAELLGIKLHIADYSAEFKEKVEKRFSRDYLLGLTPNPCVECNSNIKFSALAKEADRLGIDKISTGHYVKVVKKENGRYALCLATDRKKDQSYFLWKLSQEVLSRFVSPLENVTKDEVVHSVLEGGLMSDVSESQDICFIPDGDYSSYLRNNLTPEDAARSFSEGDFIDKNGKKLGKHKGYASYTVGQRKGLGIALGSPAYVLKITPSDNTVTLGFEEDNRAEGFFINGINFVLANSIPAPAQVLYVRPRYRSPLIPCELEGRENGEYFVRLLATSKLVSPGQSAVFYNDMGEVLFGAYIV